MHVYVLYQICFKDSQQRKRQNNTAEETRCEFPRNEHFKSRKKLSSSLSRLLAPDAAAFVSPGGHWW